MEIVERRPSLFDDIETRAPDQRPIGKNANARWFGCGGQGLPQYLATPLIGDRRDQLCWGRFTHCFLPVC